MPAISSKVVVLPHPDGPSRATNSPSAISRSSAWRAVTVPNRLVRPSSTTRIVALLALQSAAVDSHQPVLGDEEEDEDRKDVVQADRRQDPVVHEPALPEDCPHEGAQRFLRPTGHEHEREQELIPALDE